MFIPDPTFSHPGSRIRTVSIPVSRIFIKEFKYFNPPKKTKKWFLSSKKYDPGCSSRIPNPDADFLPIPDPGVKKAPDPRSATLVKFSSASSKNILGDISLSQTKMLQSKWLNYLAKQLNTNMFLFQ
jgi:hypothetical protein